MFSLSTMVSCSRITKGCGDGVLRVDSGVSTSECWFNVLGHIKAAYFSICIVFLAIKNDFSTVLDRREVEFGLIWKLRRPSLFSFFFYRPPALLIGGILKG
jgi:hypothetical protein